MSHKGRIDKSVTTQVPFTGLACRRFHKSQFVRIDYTLTSLIWLLGIAENDYDIVWMCAIINDSVRNVPDALECRFREGHTKSSQCISCNHYSLPSARPGFVLSNYNHIRCSRSPQDRNKAQTRDTSQHRKRGIKYELQIANQTTFTITK